MSWRHCIGLVLLGLSLQAYADARLSFDSSEQKTRFRELAKDLRCLKCQNQSLADSDAEIAQDLRREVLSLMKTGRDDQEIKAFLVARYSDFVLYDPPLKPSTYLLWFGPFAIFLSGIAILLITIRRRRILKHSGTLSTPAQQRLNRVLDELSKK